MVELKVRAISGPLVNIELTLRQGTVFGRKLADITLDDGRVSNRHAMVRIEKGRWKLIDLDSKNGIRSGDQRVKSVSLKPGVKFSIGSSEFEVLGEAIDVEAKPPAKPIKPDVKSKPNQPAVQPLPQPMPEPIQATTPPLKPEPLKIPESPESLEQPEPPPEFFFGEPESQAPEVKVQIEQPWKDVISNTFEDLAKELKSKPAQAIPMAFPISLHFLSGVQLRTKWLVGYGPRKIGRASIDLPILDPGAPDICFELVPAPGGGVFRTSHTKDVLLNGSSVKSKKLKSGDVISFGNTKIEVEILE